MTDVIFDCDSPPVKVNDNRCEGLVEGVLHVLQYTPPDPPPTGTGYLYDELATLQSGQSKQVSVLGTPPDPVYYEFSIKGSAAANGELHFMNGTHNEGYVDHHWKFDISTNTWSQLPDPPTTIGHGYDGVVSGDSGEIYAVNYRSGNVWVYNGTWAPLPAVPSGYIDYSTIQYFPGKGLFFFSPYDDYVWLYDGSWNSYSKPWYSSAYHIGSSYDPATDKIYFGGGQNNPYPYNSFDRDGIVTPLLPLQDNFGPTIGALIDQHVFTDASKIYFDLGSGVYYLDSSGNSWVYKK